MSTNNMHGAKPGKVTSNKKAAGGKSTTATNQVSTTCSNFTDSKPDQLELKLEFRPDKPASKAHKYSRQSTAKEAQYDRVNRAFDHAGKLISTLDFRKIGVIHPAGRIKEMNEKRGFDIAKVDLRTVVDDQGFAHPRIAIYALIERPKKVEAA
jgi:hypothetical protein